MTLRNDIELTNTEQKLQLLEKMIDDARKREGPIRDVEVRSLSRLANELREEIIRYRIGKKRRAS